MEYRIGQLTVGQILDQTLKLFRNRWKLILGLGGIIYAPFLILYTGILLVYTPDTAPEMLTDEAMAAMVENSVIVLIASLIFVVVYMLICGPLLTASITYAVEREYRGIPVTIRESLFSAFRKIVPVLWTALISGIFILFGLILLIIPGILLALRYYLVQQVVVLEHTNGSVAMKRSAELMKGSYGIAFVLGFALWILSSVLPAMAEMIPVPYFSSLISVVLQVALGVLWPLAGTVMYFHCRAKTENYDLTLMAESVARNYDDNYPVPPPLPATQYGGPGDYQP